MGQGVLPVVVWADRGGHSSVSPSIMTFHLLPSMLQLFAPRPIRKCKLLYQPPCLAPGHLHSTSTPSWHSPGMSLPMLHLHFCQDQGSSLVFNSCSLSTKQ